MGQNNQDKILCVHTQNFMIKGQIQLKGKRLTVFEIKKMITDKSTPKIKVLRLESCNISSYKINELTKGCWDSLQALNIDQNKDLFNDEACCMLAKLQAQNLATLSLWQNDIGPDGCHYLTKTVWSKLSEIDLGYNRIGNDGCKMIALTNWNITHLNVAHNFITTKGGKQLLKADWPNLCSLDLYDNQIGDLGCKWLSKANWKQLIYIELGENSINWEGCKYLSSCDWPKLQSFLLKNYKQQNTENIDDQGCLHLMVSNLKSLSTIFLKKKSSENEENKRYWPKLMKRSFLYSKLIAMS